MTKKTGDDSRDLKVVTLPVAAHPEGWSEFRNLERDADAIREAWEELCAVQRDLLHRAATEAPPIAQEADLSGSVQAKLEHSRAALARFDGDDKYNEDEDGDRVLKKPIIAARLSLLLAAVPQAARKSDQEGFARLLLEHVAAAEPSYLALESACRQIEAQNKFSPAIAEVLDAISDHEPRWHWRRVAIRQIGPLAAELRAAIPKAHAAFARAEAAARVAEAKRLCREQAYWLTRSTRSAAEAQDRARVAHRAAAAAMVVVGQAAQDIANAEAALRDAEIALAESPAEDAIGSVNERHQRDPGR